MGSTRKQVRSSFKPEPSSRFITLCKDIESAHQTCSCVITPLVLAPESPRAWRAGDGFSAAAALSLSQCCRGACAGVSVPLVTARRPGACGMLPAGCSRQFCQIGAGDCPAAQGSRHFCLERLCPTQASLRHSWTAAAMSRNCYGAVLEPYRHGHSAVTGQGPRGPAQICAGGKPPSPSSAGGASHPVPPQARAALRVTAAGDSGSRRPVPRELRGRPPARGHAGGRVGAGAALASICCIVAAHI